MADTEGSQQDFGTSVLLRGGQTDGRVAVIEGTVPAGWQGPSLHHHEWDEAFYVVEGELTFQVGDELITKRAGELAFARRGEHHTLANLSDAPARYVVFCTPSGFELYLEGRQTEGTVGATEKGGGGATDSSAAGPPRRRPPLAT